MSTLALARLTAAEWREMLSDPLKDQRYKQTGLGPDIDKFLSWFENEREASLSSVDHYLRRLARLAVRYPEYTIGQFTKEEIRDTRDTYPQPSRAGALATYRSFFKWAYNEDLTPNDPAVKVAFPKKQPRKIHAIFTQDEQAALITQGPDRRYGRPIELRDRLCILILLRAGLRRAELLDVQVEDIDLIQQWIIVRRGKGNLARVVPFADDGDLERAVRFFLSTPMPRVNRLPQHGDRILYPFTGNEFGACQVRPTKRMSNTAHHRWWRNICERAEVRYRSGHNTRHTLATDMIRQVGAERTQVVLGHASIQTTVDEYGHMDVSDARFAVTTREKSLRDVSQEAG